MTTMSRDWRFGVWVQGVSFTPAQDIVSPGSREQIEVRCLIPVNGVG